MTETGDSGKMLSVQRREEIKNIIYEKKSVLVTDMAKLFNVSSETIRRDLDSLSQEGFLIKSYGGATLSNRVMGNSSQQLRKEIFVEEKRKIAKKAAEFINPNDCIFLDQSTTVLSLCNEIERMPLVVVTNSLQVIEMLSPRENIKLVCTGGVLDRQEQAFTGLETINYLKNHYVDKSFLSCKMLSIERGASDIDEHVSEIRRNIIKYSEKSFLLVDHTKIGGSAYISSFDVGDVDYIISDTEWDMDWYKLSRSKRFQLVSC